MWVLVYSGYDAVLLRRDHYLTEGAQLLKIAEDVSPVATPNSAHRPNNRCFERVKEGARESWAKTGASASKREQQLEGG